MHGYFIDYRLYKRLTRKLPKVNQDLAARLLNNEAENEKKDADQADKKASKKKKGMSSEILKDPRFEEMFRNETFQLLSNQRGLRLCIPWLLRKSLV